MFVRFLALLVLCLGRPHFVVIDDTFTHGCADIPTPSGFFDQNDVDRFGLKDRNDFLVTRWQCNKV